MANDQSLRDHLLTLLDSDNAHLKFDDAVKDFPPDLHGKRPARGPHSPWELLEHLRITQSDILEFTRDAKHASPSFPTATGPRPKHRQRKRRGMKASPPSARIAAHLPRSYPTHRPICTHASHTATAKPSSAKSS